MFRIIWGRANSSNVMKVVWCAGELSLYFDRIDVGGVFGQTDLPAYRVMNPPGLVPTLQEETDAGIFTLWESNAICRYLGRVFQMEAPLWPLDVKQQAKVDQWMDAQQTLLNRPMTRVFWGLVRTPAEKRDMADIEAAITDTAKIWQYIEDQVSKHPYIAGDAFTLADIPWGVHAHRWFNIDYQGLSRPELPALRAWYDRLCQRPAFQKHVVAVPIT